MVIKKNDLGSDTSDSRTSLWRWQPALKNKVSMESLSKADHPEEILSLDFIML